MKYLGETMQNSATLTCFAASIEVYCASVLRLQNFFPLLCSCSGVCVECVVVGGGVWWCVVV